MAEMIPLNGARSKDRQDVRSWVLLMLLGWIGGWFITYWVVGSILGLFLDHYWVFLPLVGPVIGGIGASLGQWLHLRKRLPRMGLWPVLSLPGCVVGFGIAGWLVGDLTLAAGLAWAFSGSLMGILQSFVLQKNFRQPLWWVPISIVAWGTGGIVGSIIVQVLTNLFGGVFVFSFLDLTLVTSLAFVPLIAGLISGIGLVIMFDQFSLPDA